MKYKIKSHYNDLGELLFTPMYKRWFGWYTTLNGDGGPNYGDIVTAEKAIKKHAVRKNKIKPKTIYIDVYVNNEAVKLERL